MNTTQPTFVSRLGLAALLLGLLMPVSGHAEVTTAAAPVVSTETQSPVPAIVPADATLQAEQPAVAAIEHPQAAALKAELDALGADATPEQISAAQQAFLEKNSIPADQSEQLLKAVEALAAPADQQAGEDEAEAVVHDLSPLGMYRQADKVVKAVMIGLVLASIITWTIWIAKGLELLIARRRLRRELVDLKTARTLNQASEQARAKHSFSSLLIEDAREELQLSAGSKDKENIKERVSFRLERLVAACGRNMSQGTGVLATIGSTAPFVGLFGTVWGIMNSFIGIAKSQTTNLAVVAPGIAEALLATALGLVAAIPAVIIYNVFARSITAYKAEVADASAQVLLLLSRDLDMPSAERAQQPQMAKAV